MIKTDSSTWQQLQTAVIQPGLCTHCGACVGLAGGQLRFVETERGPLPEASVAHPVLPALAYETCPGKGVAYPALTAATFGQEPASWLLGVHRQLAVGYAADMAVRRQGASGGVITRTLCYLLETRRIDGAVVLQMGQPRPYRAQPVIATTSEAIIAAAQSVYMPVPMLTVLEEMAQFNGRLAFVGLPDQVAALRMLQQAGHPGAAKVDFVLGPYVGTNLYLGAVANFLQAQSNARLDDIAELRFRAGEWPGHLYIRLRNGRELRAEKFYYNYLIPFYITRSSLLSIDFTNELTDISVGDAWHPRYEAKGEGFSIVVARSEQGEALLGEMAAAGVVVLEETTAADALSMHGHMIDFKKRGTFIRLDWRRRLGRPVPAFGYRPATIPRSRYLVEMVISGLFVVCGTRPARRLVTWVPIGVLGPLFDWLRRSWKNFSKPAKRQGLGQVAFEETQ